jgi:hypothetical protein
MVGSYSLIYSEGRVKQSPDSSQPRQYVASLFLCRTHIISVCPPWKANHTLLILQMPDCGALLASDLPQIMDMILVKAESTELEAKVADLKRKLELAEMDATRTRRLYQTAMTKS